MPRELLQNSGTSCSLTVVMFGLDVLLPVLLAKTPKTLQKLLHHLLPAMNI